MGNFEDTKPKSKEETLAYALEMLEKTNKIIKNIENEFGDLRFSYHSFSDAFKRYLIKAEILKDG